MMLIQLQLHFFTSITVLYTKRNYLIVVNVFLIITLHLVYSIWLIQKFSENLETK